MGAMIKHLRRGFDVCTVVCSLSAEVVVLAGVFNVPGAV